MRLRRLGLSRYGMFTQDHFGERPACSTKHDQPRAAEPIADGVRIANALG